MEEILKRLGEDGRIIVKVATDYSKGLMHYYLGTEHLFIAMAKLEGSLTQKVLAHFGLDPKRTRDLLKIAAVLRYDRPPWEGIPLTPRLRRALEAADRLASDEGHSLIGERHLLLAILEDEDSLPSRVLQGIGEERGFDRLQFLAKAREIPWSPPPEGGPLPYDLEASFGRPRRERVPPQPPRPPSPGAPTPMLDKYGRDLTRLAREGKLHAAIGVDDILRRIGRVLIQREANNPLIIGEAGVGKTAIVEGFAYRLTHGPPVVPELADKRIVELSVTSLIAGTRYRGDLEERIERVIAEVRANPNIVIFIDEIHKVLGGGTSDSLTNLADALKPALARGEFPCIGATTISEYRKHIERDAALARRFEVILVEEPSVEACIKILEGLKSGFEAHYGVAIEDEALKAAVRLSARYLPDERLPAKAVKLLEQACPMVKMPSITKGKIPGDRPVFDRVSEELIRYLLAEKTGIPLARLTTDELARLKGMEEWLNERVIGQEEAVREVVQVVKLARAGLADPTRPVGVFLFVGPTGVGKTELARSLAEFLFGSEEAMIRLDMSEYMEKHQVSRLIGAPPGYVGYEEEGQLTGRLRLRPYSVVLLDEVEKAHPDVHHLFLQLFDEGRLTDARGRTADGREAIFIMTSNIGSEIYGEDALGFVHPRERLKAKREEVERAIRATFKPEFLNRVDRIVHFNPLSPSDLGKIFDIQFKEVKDRLDAQRGISLTIAEEAVRFVCEKGYDPLRGARPLRRAIDRLIVQPLTDLILEGKVHKGDTIVIGFDGVKLVFTKAK